MIRYPHDEKWPESPVGNSFLLLELTEFFFCMFETDVKKHTMQSWDRSIRIIIVCIYCIYKEGIWYI